MTGVAAHIRDAMPGWLHEVSVGACWFVPPQCGFSISLYCNNNSLTLERKAGKNQKHIIPTVNYTIVNRYLSEIKHWIPLQNQPTSQVAHHLQL